MTLYRDSVGQPLGQIRQELDRLFNDLTRSVPFAAGLMPTRAFPPANMWETDHELYVEAELPGVQESDLEILVVGNELTIKGNRQQPQCADSVFHRRERATGPFSRTVRLPVDVDAGKVEASLRSGVLEIKLPKAEAAKPRKIKVTAI
jgi:HSP20 family protein